VLIIAVDNRAFSNSF